MWRQPAARPAQALLTAVAIVSAVKLRAERDTAANAALLPVEGAEATMLKQMAAPAAKAAKRTHVPGAGAAGAGSRSRSCGGAGKAEDAAAEHSTVDCLSRNLRGPVCWGRHGLEKEARVGKVFNDATGTCKPLDCVNCTQFIIR